jgi:antitoxin Phd
MSTLLKNSQIFPTPQPDWQLQDAKNRFSQVVRAAQSGVPQWVTVHGKRAVVVLSAQEFAQLSPEPAAVSAKPSLLDDLMSPGFFTDDEIAQYFERDRSKDSVREVDFSDV